jgi:hypothetical protein
MGEKGGKQGNMCQGTTSVVPQEILFLAAALAADGKQISACGYETASIH